MAGDCLVHNRGDLHHYHLAAGRDYNERNRTTKARDYRLVGAFQRNAVRREDEAGVRAWSNVPVTSAQGRIGDGAWSDLRSTGALAWSFAIPGDTLPKGERTLEVRLTDSNNAIGSDKLTLANVANTGSNASASTDRVDADPFVTPFPSICSRRSASA